MVTLFFDFDGLGPKLYFFQKLRIVDADAEYNDKHQEKGIGRAAAANLRLDFKRQLDCPVENYIKN